MVKTLLPYALLFVAMCSYSLLDVLGKKLKLGMPTFLMIGLTMAILSVMALTTHFLTNKTYTLADIDQKAWLLIGLFALVNFVGFSTWMSGIAQTPVYSYRVLNLAAPVIVALLGFWILKEQVDWKSLITGLAIISIGIYIVIKNNF